MSSTASKRLFALASFILGAIIFNGLYGQNWLRDTYWLLPVAAFLCAIFFLLSVVTAHWFAQAFETLAKQVPILATFFILLAVAALVLAPLVLGLRWGLQFSKRNLPKSEQNKSVADSKLEAIPRVVPPTNRSPAVPADSRRPKSSAATENVLVPPLRGTSQFVSYVVLYSDNSMLCMMNTNFLRNSSCGDVRDAFKAQQNRGQDRISSLDEVLQHYMVPLIYAAGTGWGLGGAAVDGRFAETQIAPIEPPESVNYAPSHLVEVSQEHFYPFWFSAVSNEPRMKLPKDTTILFLNEDKPQEHPHSYIARLERKGYYRMDFSVYQYGAPRLGEIPEKYTVPDWLNVSQATTYSFLVRVDWTLERSHGASFVIEDYDNWARQVSGSVRDRLQN